MTIVKKGFTLIELVMVIVILGILAAVTLPKFVNFKTNAIEKADDHTAGALNTAIKLNQISYVTAGGDPTSAYPFVVPFILLGQSPPYQSATGGELIIPDGVTWRYVTLVTGKAQGIMCPHWNGNSWDQGGTKGRYYIYQNAIPCTGYSWDRPVPGDFWLYHDLGH